MKPLTNLLDIPEMEGEKGRMSRAKAVYELQCWSCDKVVEFEVCGPHRCPRCGADFEIVREEETKPEPDVDSGAGEVSAEQISPATGAAQRLYGSRGLWATVDTETEIVPGVAISPAMVGI